MLKHLNITILVDNRSNQDNLKSEHGLSLWIEADDRKILFDAGQSDILLQNAKTLGIDLSSADTFIISHGHYDHTGGLESILQVNPSINIYCHSGVFSPRYSRQPDGRTKPVGMQKKAYAALHKKFDHIKWVNTPRFLNDHIGITGPIPRKSTFEDTGGAFYFDYDAKRPDLINDDMAMWFRTGQGLCIVTGCCHSGLVNTISYIQSLEPEIPVYMILGGLHLVNASGERIKNTCDFLNSLNINQIIPCHCTGDKAVEYMQNRLGKSVEPGEVGKKIDISE